MAPRAVGAAIALAGLGGSRGQSARTGRYGALRVLDDAVSVEISPRFAFVASLSVGTPPQPLRCLLDTGSAETWVPSARCASCTTERSFNASQSSTFAPTLLPGIDAYHVKAVSVEMDYGTGRIVGYAAQDTVALGNTSISNASFLIVEEADLPRHKMWDGILGLGWSGLQNLGRPVYSHLQEQRQRAMFTIVPTGSADASMIIGELPQTSLKPDSLVWAAAEDLGHSTRTFWTVSGQVVIGGTSWRSMFILDSGTNMVMMTPGVTFAPVLEALLGRDHVEKDCYLNPASTSGDVLCDCKVTEDLSLPSLQIVFGGRTFEFDTRELFLKVPVKGGGEKCLLEIQPNSILFDEVASNLSEKRRQQVVAGSRLRNSRLTANGMRCRDAADRSEVLCTPLRSARDRRLPDGSSEQGTTVEEGLWMLGGMFMARYVTVFDFDNARVGFAKLAADKQPADEVLPWVEEDAVPADLKASDSANTLPVAAALAGAAAAFLGLSVMAVIRRTVRPTTGLGICDAEVPE